jgi:glycosyltransferase involved in cell wall biosynthesis
VGQVVRDFRAALPGAVVYVYDNNSRDRTAEVAREAGAVVRRAPLQGKGNVVRAMFSDVDADAYVLVDGDGTYEAAASPPWSARSWRNGLDMVSGARASEAAEAYRPGHRFGNWLLTTLVREIFGRRSATCSPAIASSAAAS